MGAKATRKGSPTSYYFLLKAPGTQQSQLGLTPTCLPFSVSWLTAASAT